MVVGRANHVQDDERPFFAASGDPAMVRSDLSRRPLPPAGETASCVAGFRQSRLKRGLKEKRPAKAGREKF
ncbi:hypothetical protein CCR94_19425 [Rhodoblastus sphagnicola]|uniref:Uncharacterized protein n=1 Tax=Rhodoblastus sphagnicola TaxID=333368 RepID=A0A2S6MZ53_9HYPH|nr:hypothetical protein CCR94_19425 [Rhodoblastus sphagnicola]